MATEVMDLGQSKEMGQHGMLETPNFEPGSVELLINSSMRSVFVVLPAYNEEEDIGRLLHRLNEAMNEAGLSSTVIVVNDGSSDSTGRILEERGAQMRLIVLHHKRNLGLGTTIRDGLLMAADAAAPQDVVVTMDADDTHPPRLIPNMVRRIDAGYDVVIASRYQPGSRTVGVPLTRRALSHGASWLFRALFPIPGVKDYTCGFRAYRAGVIQEALSRFGDRFIDQNGFQCMADILLKLRRMPLAICEVPLVLRYDLKQGRSKMNVCRTVFGTFRLMVNRRLEARGKTSRTE